MDIISGLPDPILCHILSFLPIKFSVATSVLARSWRFLWTYVRDLDFDEQYYDSRSEKIMGFLDVVGRVLLLHNGSIDSLSIRAESGASERQLNAWIKTASARNVRSIDLYNFWSSRCLLKCKTLVELYLHVSWVSAKPGGVCLPLLKKLKLYSNCYENDEALPNLVSGCPAIEDLVIERYVNGCDGMTCCYVCSPTLKSLVLVFEFFCDEHEHKVVLDIPAVQYLRIYDNLYQIICAEKLSSLVAADISLCNDYLKGDSRSMDMFQFVEKLSNAKSLTLTNHDLMKLLNPTFSIATTRFHNLTDLELEADWHLLTELLESAHKLESLTIQEGERELKCWREPKHLPNCLLSTLKYVSVRGFAGREHELNMVRYILGHAKALERIEIYSVYRGKNAYSELKILEQNRIFHEDLRHVGLPTFEIKLAGMTMILSSEIESTFTNSE